MADIAIIERTGFGLATVLLAHGAEGPVQASDLTLLPTGRGVWLAYAPDAAPDRADGLALRLEGRAHVVDQSAAYVLFAVSGADACRLLQKGMSVDLDPLVWPPGAVVVSAIAHIGVIAHRIDLYHIHLFTARSSAASLRHWLGAACAAL